MTSPLPIFAVQLPEMTGPYRARNWKTVTILRILDIFGSWLPKRQRLLTRDRKLRVLIINWGHLGDVVTLLPLLKFLEVNEAIESIGVLTGSWAHEVLNASDIKATRHTLDHWALNRIRQNKFVKILSYIRQAVYVANDLRKKKYDVSIDTFSTFPVSHALTWSAGIGCRVGFNSAGFGTLLTHPVNWLPSDMRVIDQQLRLLDAIPELKRPVLLKSEYPGFVPANIPTEIQIPTEGYIVFHMGSGDSIRRWPSENWVSLSHSMRKKGFNIIFSGGPGAEADLAKNISAQTACTNAAGYLSWPQFVTLISKAKMVVCVDTVIGHLAACFSIPTIVLTAGRQRIAYWHPNNPHATSLSYPVGCSPCYRTNGCGPMACIRLIEVPTVISAIFSLLEEQRSC